MVYCALFYPMNIEDYNEKAREVYGKSLVGSKAALTCEPALDLQEESNLYMFIKGEIQ